MAKLWLECNSFWVMLIFSWFSSAKTSQDYYFYRTEDVSDCKGYYTFRLDGIHEVQKRMASEPINEFHVSSTDNMNNTLLPIIYKNTSKALDKNITEETISSKNPFQHMVEINSIKNLGENGTGIWWNSTTMTTPTIPKYTETENSTKTVVKNEVEVDNDDIIFPDNINYDNTTFLNQHNITSSKTDTHVYYNSTLTVGENYFKQYWVDMTNRSDVKVNQLLSNSYRRAATLRLSFDFPYYGHPVRNITIATGGFLYTGTDIHSWLAATQYVAPLMANFDTSLSTDSCIKYLDNGSALTVEWEKVLLQDNPDAGNFTFQATLINNGDIIFVYKNVPMLVENIRDDKHPVKVGISDAYVRDRMLFMIRRKTIYEYHKVRFNKEDIKNWTVIHLTALPNCPTSKDCVSCLSEDLSYFKCSWCPKMNKCSNGYDRSRQRWLALECDKIQITDKSLCKFGNTSVAEVYEGIVNDDQDETMVHASRSEALDGSVNIGWSGIMTIICLFTLIGGLGIWVFYAYRNPHTTSGQMLIRYRPSQWRWRRGEARYTAATIHM